ncbi:MAG: hypothetical protein IJS08_10100 [Victivallales bacterium]|nr:hypothetical protein [Victivallales bacterium]
MRKIPVTSWIKMFVVVSIHLYIVGVIIYYYREPIINYSTAGWGYVMVAYGSCVNFVEDVWETIPSLDQLSDGFFNILKLKPFR